MYSKICDPKIMKTMLPKDFPADKLSRPEYEPAEIEKNVRITMRDGIKIAIDIFKPKGRGPFPVILASTCYQKRFSLCPPVPAMHFVENNDPYWFVKRGYIFVTMDQRGSGESEGVWNLHGKDTQQDFYEVIEWLGTQSWSNGKVGMLGESFLGISQWFAAATQPPHLACIVPFDAGADWYRDLVYAGGALNFAFPSAWHIYELRGNYQLTVKKYKPDPTKYTWDLANEILMHQTFDEFWETRRADFSKIKCPVYSIGFWHKHGIHLRGNTRGYEEINAPKKLLLCHGEFEGDEMAIYNTPEIRQLMLRWYDHWLKGNDTGFMDEPPVSLFIHGLNKYRPENEWPLKRVEYTKMYLAAGKSGAVDSLNDGKLLPKVPRAAKASVTYSYPQQDWSHFSGIGCAVMDKGLMYTHKRVLTFTTAPFEKDMEVCGHGKLVLWASTEQEYPEYKDTKFMVRLYDQLPDEAQSKELPLKGPYLARGGLVASMSFERDAKLERPWRPYYSHKNPKEIENGKIYKYEIEILPFANLFKKGHRLRIELANHSANPLDFGGHYYGLQVGQDTIYFDKDHPSHIILPVSKR